MSAHPHRTRPPRLAAFALVLATFAAGPATASHSLGPVDNVMPPVTIAPGGGAVPFSSPGSTFLFLGFDAGPAVAGDRIRVTTPMGGAVVVALTPGERTWSPPVPGDSATLEYLDDGDGTGSASLVRFGRGTTIDLFQLYGGADPPFSPGGLCAGAPNWSEVACLSDTDPTQNLIRQTAESVGLFVMIHGGHVSSCSATLVDDDLILTAAHCVSEANFGPSGVSTETIGSGWFTLGFEAGTCAGTAPADFPRFHKLVRAVRTGFTDPPDSRLDYALVQIDAGPSGVGAPPLQIRTTPVTAGTQLFGVHHPRGTRKKVSQAVPTPLCTVGAVNTSIVTFDCDVDNGSSGSSVFDTAGRIVGVADWAGGCGNQAQAATVVRPDFLTPLPLSSDVDTVAVFDRSGSMSLPAPGGASKLHEAKQAASLFFDLLRTDASHQAGLVSFNQTPSNDHDLAPIDATAKQDLIRVAPPGVVQSIVAGGNTSIGAGLELGRQRLDAVGTVNQRTLLLITDGLQNSAPSIEVVEPSLADTRICAIGFGSEASLDGPLLSRLARDHGGLYTRADRGLDLRKFFALCFGLIFESGISMDPDYQLHAGQTHSEKIPIPVCGETDLTVVVVWEERRNFLLPTLRTPGGALVDSSTPGVTSSLGPTWSYLRFPLPLAGERDGTWTLVVHRPEGSGEFGQPLGQQDFAVVSVIDGGPTLKPAVSRPLYTGDLLDPLVILRDDAGDLYPAEIAVEVERPVEGTGNLLTARGLGAATTVDGDALNARVSTLLELEAAAGGQLIPTSTFSLTLRDDGVNDERALEPDGQYGARVPDLLTREGHYTFHARARFGNVCTAQRETFWSTYVAVGVDPERTGVEGEEVGSEPDGRTRVRVRVTPRDRYGNHVGPGRGDEIDFGGLPGSEVVDGPADQGDGSYVVDVAWDPGSGRAPGVVVGQPERPPVELPADGFTPAGGKKAGRGFSLAFGGAIPVGSGNAGYDPGFAAVVSYHHPLGARTSLVGSLGYAGFGGDRGSDLGLADLALSVRWDTGPAPATRFFALGGLGHYAAETDLGGGEPGAHLGVGVTVPILRSPGEPVLELEMGLTGHRTFGDDEVDFLRATLGLTVRP